MKRREVIKKIAVAARRQRAAWMPIPRHTELGEVFAVDIFKECEEVLGKGWWRK